MWPYQVLIANCYTTLPNPHYSLLYYPTKSLLWLIIRLYQVLIVPYYTALPADYLWPTMVLYKFLIMAYYVTSQGFNCSLLFHSIGFLFVARYATPLNPNLCPNMPLYQLVISGPTWHFIRFLLLEWYIALPDSHRGLPCQSIGLSL